MGRVTCTYWGCGCKIDLTEVTAEQEAFVCALIEARDGRSDLFKAYIDPQGRRHGTSNDVCKTTLGRKASTRR
jgi:hypothetical protein